jgi:colanic acid/amylovoran biosynthesis glycosyltransferase
MKLKDLILITSNFPYEIREPFLEQEILIISKYFRNIYIISQDNFSDKCREVPANTKVYKIDTNLKKKELSQLSIKAIFTKAFYIELFHILFVYNKMLNMTMLKDLLYTISAGIKIRNFIRKIINDENLNQNNLILYSYWMDKGAFAISQIKGCKNNCHSISRAHSFDIYQWRNKNNYLPLKKYIYKRLNSIYFISYNGKNYFKNTYKINDLNKSKISRLGTINHQPFHPIQNTNNEMVIISCAGISELKRLDKIIDALSLIDNFKIKWIHIGDDPYFKGFENKIKAYAFDKLGTKENIKYDFAGRFTNKELIQFYINNDIDLFINTSSIEGLPVTFMEAMSFGIPVIGPDIGGINEIVNTSNGVLLSPDPGIEEIANAIIKIHSLNDAESILMRENAYKMWKDNYNAELNYKNFVEEIINL